MNIIAIDIGTSNCKAVITGTDLKALKTFEYATTPITPRQGWNEQNAVTIFNAVVKLLQQSIRFCGEENIACVSFSAAMHSFLAVDKNGVPLINMITWADLRSAKYAQALEKKNLAKKLYKATGVPIHAMSPLCKLMWLKAEQKAIFRRAHKFISIKEYIFFKLFGKYIIDHSIAAATGLMDAKNICWYGEALRLADITKEQLSELKPVEHYETALLSPIKKKLKLKKEIPFVLGASDGALANLGCGIVNANNAAVTVGTSGAVRITSNKFLIDKKQRLFCYYIGDGAYITGGALNNGGIVLQWLVEKILKQPFRDEKQLDVLFKSAAAVKPGSNGLIFLPYILGERAPVWDENAKGCFIGLTETHTEAHIIRAALEGVCFAVVDVLLALEETSGNIKNIYLSGGILKSEVWVQLLADISGKKIMLNEAADASALGAAFIGRKALGNVKSLAAAKMFLQNVKTVKPSAANHRIYKKYFTVYNDLYGKLKNVFAELTAIN
ncbi:gluconokinase [Parafilimonas terrae]|uniref:Gluconate kinase, FGGY family n=1 Tax=Parafilimonas terrae TaxID=1465490 RepID=A0A1I5SR37_9BACT|nr:gluconokinase [Parafilimonas terrae]SFP73091.1 gluconate kinase, FGGY family [Parafilimonas terrae]